MSEIKTFGYFVNNRWHEPADSAYFESENPATAQFGHAWPTAVPPISTAPSPQRNELSTKVHGDACFRLNGDAIFGGLAT